MKKITLYSTLAMLAVSLSSCEVIGDIFKAGMWTGVIIIVLVVALLFWLLRKLGGRR